MGTKLDWEKLLAEQEWLQQTDLPMVVSPDFDGLLCALLMTHYRNWRLCGFYDGRKLTLVMPPTHVREFVFLDMEIYRPFVRSIGNHLLQWSQRTLLPDFTHAVNPNLLRGITAQQFDRKYPFATFHFLLVLLTHMEVSFHLTLNPSLLAILLYPDGTHQVLLNYRRNVMDWLDWMSVKATPAPIRTLFQRLASVRLADVVHGLEWLSGQLQEIGFRQKDDPCKFDPEVDLPKAQALWQFLQQNTGWQSPSLPLPNWTAIFDVRSTALKAASYRQMLEQNPLSFALTSRSREQGLQYTLVPQNLRSLTD
ncbi:hypothetical protein Q2T83_06380 [Fervidibacter sacchari]|nr:hypothetical protein [Candidatus Fervidibacter sacchari]WKU17442.1 hypothetical protein Q2T83_06380 [Candidatus Fervidibacter sacchari]